MSSRMSFSSRVADVLSVQRAPRTFQVSEAVVPNVTMKMQQQLFLSPPHPQAKCLHSGSFSGHKGDVRFLSALRLCEVRASAVIIYHTWGSHTHARKNGSPAPGTAPHLPIQATTLFGSDKF